MTQIETKERKEYLVFRAFAMNSNGLFDSSSIENKKSPEPDIFCRTVRNEKVAFELLEIIDEDFAKMFATIESGVLGGWTDDPTAKKLMQKFGKTYESEYQIHLLAYFDHTPRFPNEIWKPKLTEFLKSREDFGRFHSIWFYDIPAREILIPFTAPNFNIFQQVKGNRSPAPR